MCELQWFGDVRAGFSIRHNPGRVTMLAEYLVSGEHAANAFSRSAHRALRYPRCKATYARSAMISVFPAEV